MRRLLALLLLCCALPGLPADLPQKVATIEGVTEYRLANGLRVLMVPDPSADTVTVHITYLVGSRHEGYGEKGMAHLLEHMLFKGTPRRPSIKEELTRRGARYNGSTSWDRTNYFETLSASADNLDWALGMEADRMLNSRVRKQDLDSEMTVVRNEFEMGENRAGSVLFERTMQLAFPWHNYGRAIIGARSDIESVPIANLRAFYRTYYRPDNALLAIGGRFDERKALALVARHFGPLARPARALPALYTAEPTQDGERSVMLRRAGDTQMVSALYRVPAGSHPDYPALDVLVSALRVAPEGRLHQALVQKGLASSVWGWERPLHDPGFVNFGAELGKEASLDAARDALLAVVESLGREPLRAEEVERARLQLLNEMEKAQIEGRSYLGVLGEFHAIGDWRLLFLYRDRLKVLSVADVNRVAAAYLRPANRVLGLFVPTAAPERAEIPPAPDLQQALAGYRGREAVDAGEPFDPSPRNIEARVQRRTLANGIQVALLPKRTRGAKVVVQLNLNWGDEASKAGRSTACSLAGGMLLRGTQRRSRAELREAFERLKATVSVSADGASVQTQREFLADALRLVAEVLREPAFPPAEFEELKRSALTAIEAQRSDPAAIAAEQLARHLQPYPRGHWLYTPTLEERVEDLQAATLEQARACHRDLVGASGAHFVAVGDFDAAQLADLVQELFGGWSNPAPYARIPSRYFDQPALERELRTPDKANAVLRAGLNLPMRDDDADYPAMILGSYLLGGTSTGRLPARIREKEGLSYSTTATFSASPLDALAGFGASAIFAPQNKARVERALREEIVRARAQGFGAAELEAAKKGLLEGRRLARTQDGALASRLSNYLYAGRSFAWDEAFERRIAALTADEVRDALRRHLDPARLSVAKAGDFK
jgi:zinc protease